MGENTGRDPSPEQVYEEMAVLEPYTTGELASRLDAPRRRVRDLLETLVGAGKVRKKEPEPERVIWIREAPVHECDGCGYEFEVKFLHPVLSSVAYCPHCARRV